MKRIGHLHIILIVVAMVVSGIALAILEVDAGSGPPLTPEQRQQWLDQSEAAEAEWVLRRDMTALNAAVGPYADVEEAVAAGYPTTGDCVTSSIGVQSIHYTLVSASEPTVVADAPQRVMNKPQWEMVPE